MKSKTLATFAMILGIALSAPAFAQGRHDEKPHGMAKNPPAQATDTERKSAGSGRHDEKPHGMKKSAKKADDTAKGGK
jgi:hypothetical protein